MAVGLGRDYEQGLQILQNRLHFKETSDMPKTIYLTYPEMLSLGCAISYGDGPIPALYDNPPGKPWSWGLPDGPPYAEEVDGNENWFSYNGYTATFGQALYATEECALERLNPYRCEICFEVFTEYMAAQADWTCDCGGTLESVSDTKPRYECYCA